MAQLDLEIIQILSSYKIEDSTGGINMGSLKGLKMSISRDEVFRRLLSTLCK